MITSHTTENSLSVEPSFHHDEHAAVFDRLYRANRPIVYGFCFRMTRNIEDAKDLTQGVFLKLYTNLSKIHEGSEQAWLRRVAFRDALHHLKRYRQRHSSLEEMLEQPPDILKKRMTIRDHTVSRLSVDQALTKLPAKKRICFELKYLHGCEHEEIARIMDCVPGTSKSQCSKACATVLTLLGYGDNVSSRNTSNPSAPVFNRQGDMVAPTLSGEI